MKRTKFLLGLSLVAVIAFGFTCHKTAVASADTQKEIAIVEESNTAANENAEAEPQVGTNVGNIAPDIEMAGVDGKMIKLSDLRGKMVLIDFWASWCGPCRRENPNVVAAYNKYNKAKFEDAKGFEIFSVSFDMGAAKWKQAIEADKLAWPYHVSDLKGWKNAAGARYGVRSIPFSLLIDANGVIIAKNLRGPKLHMELDKYVKKL